MQNTIQEKLPVFFRYFPHLFPLITKLNQNNIWWLIGGSGCLFLHGNDRKPGDVDILLPNNQHETADNLFDIKSYIITSNTQSVRNSNPYNNHSLQLTSHLEIRVNDHIFTFDYGDIQVQEKAMLVPFQDQLVRIAPPEDALIIKAILQRGVNEGKQDLEDINNFLEISPDIDKKYLQSRINNLGARDRTAGILG